MRPRQIFLYVLASLLLTTLWASSAEAKDLAYWVKVPASDCSRLFYGKTGQPAIKNAEGEYKLVADRDRLFKTRDHAGVTDVFCDTSLHAASITVTPISAYACFSRVGATYNFNVYVDNPADDKTSENMTAHEVYSSCRDTDDFSIPIKVKQQIDLVATSYESFQQNWGLIRIHAIPAISPSDLSKHLVFNTYAKKPAVTAVYNSTKGAELSSSNATFSMPWKEGAKNWYRIRTPYSVPDDPTHVLSPVNPLSEVVVSLKDDGADPILDFMQKHHYQCQVDLGLMNDTGKVWSLHKSGWQSITTSDVSRHVKELMDDTDAHQLKFGTSGRGSRLQAALTCKAPSSSVLPVASIKESIYYYNLSHFN